MADPGPARRVPALELALALLAATGLFAMMWITVLDVLGRDLIGVPIPGSFELTEMVMGVVVFAGLPLITARDGHIAVTLLDPVLGRRARTAQRVAIDLICLVLLGGLAWRLWSVARTLGAYGDTTMIMGMPLAPLAYFMAAMTAASAAVAAVLALRHMRAGGA